jgi:hypothetical protein
MINCFTRTFRVVPRVAARLVIVFAVCAAGAAIVTSCSTFDSALAMAMGGQGTGNPPQQQNQPAGGANNAASSDQAGNAVAYQYEFGSFYQGFFNSGWFGSKDSNYQVGQGTIWQITPTGRDSNKPVSFERALLKVMPDGSQWWRFKMTTPDSTILYEFLLGADGIVKKVRFQDPSSGAIDEFVPQQQQQRPNPQPMPTRDQIASSLVGHENVTVPAGTFAADHYAFTDPKSGYKMDMWISQKVPGYMVRFNGVNPSNNEGSNGTLQQIETGVTTALQSF